MTRISWIPRLLLTAALAVIGAVGAAAAPAAAGDVPVQVTSRTTLNQICTEIQGSYSEYPNGIGTFGCAFADARFWCDETLGCKYLFTLDPLPALSDACDKANGLFDDKGKGVLECLLKDIYIQADCGSYDTVVECTLLSEQPMNVGGGGPRT